MGIPPRYISARPNYQTIFFGGHYIDAVKLASDLDLNHSYVTRILAGDRMPSLPYLEKLADALHLSLDEMRESINERKEKIDTRKQQHRNRILRRA